jgi:exosortase family protein XrtF
MNIKELVKKNIIEKPIIWFLTKAAMLWIFWLLIYGQFLKRLGIDDPLSYFIANLTAWIYKLMGYETGVKKVIPDGLSVEATKFLVTNNNMPVINIDKACNGMELYALFISFLIAFGGKYRFWQYVILGSISIFAINLFRIVALVWIMLYYPSQVDFHHHYTFSYLIYAYIIWLWFLFINTQNVFKKSQNIES